MRLFTQFLVTCTLLVSIAFAEDSPATPNAPSTVFLADLKPTAVEVFTKKDWAFSPTKGTLKRDGSLKISVNGEHSPNGIGTHPNAKGKAHLVYVLSQPFTTFSGSVALDDSAVQSNSPLTFQIVGNDKLLWKSTPIQQWKQPQQFSVDITGVKKLELYVLCPGDHGNAHAVWVEPTLSNKPQLPEPVVFTGHKTGVGAAIFLPDGKRAVSVGNTDIFLWDIATGKQLDSFLGHTAVISSVAASHDGNFIATASTDTTARVWDLHNGRSVNVFQNPHEATKVAFSNDDHYLFVGGFHYLARIFDLKTGQPVENWPPHQIGGYGAAWSHNGQYLATIGTDEAVYLWDAKTFKQVRAFTGGKLEGYSVAFSPDDRFLLSAHIDHVIRLWDVASGKLVNEFKDRKVPVSTVEFNPKNGNQFISTAPEDGNTFLLWDVPTARPIQRYLGHTGKVGTVAYSADGALIVSTSTDGTARTWHADSPNAAPRPAAGAVASIAPPIPAPQPASTNSPSTNSTPVNDLKIIDAKWGTEHHQVDVTEKLRDLVKDGALRCTISVTTLGDPAPFKPKMLALIYLARGEKITLHLQENDDLDITSAPLLPADPNVIERPEFKSKSKPIVKNITSLTSMAVHISDSGDAFGMTSDIIATVPESHERHPAPAVFVGKVGNEMRTSFDEAIRAVQLRYPHWDGELKFSFGEKYSEHDGGSAGTAFAVLLLSALEGIDLDPKCAITGDITVDWKVREVGAIAAKLHGATVDKCLYALIPEKNESALDDMRLLYSDHALWDIQIFSISTLQEAISVIRTDRAPQLTEAMKIFADLQLKLNKGGLTALATPDVQQDLDRVLQLAPNHLSAKALLAVARHTAPQTLSLGASVYELSLIYYPYRRIFDGDERATSATLNQTAVLNARKQIARLRKIGNKDIQPVVNDLSTLFDNAESVANDHTSKSNIAAKRDIFLSHLNAIVSDHDAIENLVRGGY